MAKKQMEENAAEATPVEQTPARPKLASVTRTEDDKLVILFADQTNLEVNPEDFSDDIKFELMMLGLGNKMRDSWASAKGELEFAKGAANKTLDNLKNGLFTASRASGQAVQKVGELAQAIANLKGKAVADVQAIIAQASEEQIAMWRKNAQVKAEILRIRHEAAVSRLAKANPDDLEI